MAAGDLLEMTATRFLSHTDKMLLIKNVALIYIMDCFFISLLSMVSGTVVPCSVLGLRVV